MDDSKEQRYVAGISLQARINLIGVVIMLMFVSGLHLLVLPQMKRDKLDEREGKLRAVVGSMLSVMEANERAVRNPESAPAPGLPETLESAQESARTLLRMSRYDSNEFFFVLDGDGDVLMHALRPELEGTNILDQVSPDGGHPFRDLVTGSQRDGEAVVRHQWQSKYSAEIFEPQITYAAYFWPWDWVVCSSVYVQDIEDSSREVTVRTAMYVAIAATIAMLLLFLFNYYSLNRPLRRLLEGIRAIRRGDLEARIDETGRDELGYISRQFNAMVDEVAAGRRSTEASEKKYKDLSELLPDVIYEVDPDLNLTYLNEAAFTMTGYGRDDLAAGLSLKTIIPEAELAEIRDLVGGRFVEGTGRVFLSHKFLTRDGRVLFGENHVVPILGDGRIRGARGVLRDVTEKVEMERGLVQSQKMETIGTLAGGIAHDFNNVLGGIMGTISLMEHTLAEQGGLTRENLHEDLENLNNATMRAANMVNQILALSRKHTLALETVDLNGVLTNVEVLCRSSFDKKIEMEFREWEAGAALVEADPTQLEQILLNLCVNARDAMTIMRPEGSSHAGRLEVALSRVEPGHELLARTSAAIDTAHWCVRVRDEGVGMDSATMEAAFDPFFTTKAKGQGTGLGLAMVYNILQQHGGRIDVESQEGQGTTVTMLLPGVEQAVEAAEAVVGNEELVRGAGLVLIVDDDVHVRRIGQRILERAGYDVITAEDGEKGIALFEERRDELDLVLLDMVMPRLSGRDVFLRLREIDPQVKVLMSSGFRMDERIQEVLDLGAAGFIQKPFGVVELSREVWGVLGGE